MTLSVSPVPRAQFTLTPLMLGALALGTALSPLSTKIAGATWLVWCLWGLALRLVPAAGSRSASPVSRGALPAAHAWAAACVSAMAFAMAKALYWGDPLDEVYAQLRLVLAAAAAWWVLSRTALPEGLRPAIGDALSAQALAALGCIAWLLLHYPDPRNMLPANAIPWAQAIAFGLCLLMPLALQAQAQPAWRRRLWCCALGLGSLALLMSQSRGAFAVFGWMLWLLAARWRELHRCWPWRRLATLAAAAGLAVSALWWAPSDPLRMRLAEQEISRAETEAAYDTSMGVRLYLWNMALQGLRESPLVGVGETERMRRIKHAGEELSPAQHDRLAVVRTMGHVHNQYLHAALDGGILGLAAVLALMAGMALAAWRLRRVDRLAARQMFGLLLVHAAGGLTNVNLAHNYYVVSLAVAASIVLLGAGGTARRQAA